MKRLVLALIRAIKNEIKETQTKDLFLRQFKGNSK
jgi:hypothetical protein